MKYYLAIFPEGHTETYYYTKPNPAEFPEGTKILKGNTKAGIRIKQWHRYAILIILSLIIGLTCGTLSTADYTIYEDGSFQVTGCIPGGLCED